MKGWNINDIFPLRWKYQGETIGDVLKKDSGYIKDLIRLHHSFCLSEECMAEAQKITKGFKDEWVKPQNPKTLLDYAKPYGIPYGFDFNNEEIINFNRQKINNQ